MSIESAVVQSPATHFTTDMLDWVPWVEPVAEDELTDVQREAMVQPGRAKNAYFRLLARDPAILFARTKADLDIFYNTDGGLPRGERELAALAASRVNGCIYCASVHSRFAARFTKMPDDVQRLLDGGPEAEQGPRWRAIIDVAHAVTRTPSQLTAAHLEDLASLGMDGLAISDVIHGAAFFNWANRLMLSLGEPVVTS